jgi:hypothetical protein
VARSYPNSSYRRGLRRRARQLLTGLAVSAPLVAAGGIPAGADFSQSAPGGCTVVVTTLPPTSCDFVNLASDHEQIVVAGVSATVADVTPSLPCSRYVTTTFPTGRSLDANEIGGCEYSLTLNGAGVASASDISLIGWGSCAAVNPGPGPITPGAPNSSMTCDYLAILTNGIASNSGLGIGAIVTTTLSSAIRIEVDDGTFGSLVKVTSCTASGAPIVSNACNFQEKTGHHYFVTTTLTAGTAQALAAVGVG